MDNGVALFESRAILTYLINKYAPDSPLYPRDPVEQANVNVALYWDATALYATHSKLWVRKIRGGTEPSEDDLKLLHEKLDLLVKLIGNKKFIASDQVSLADITIGAYLPNTLKVAGSNAPQSLNEYYERVVGAVPALAEINREADKAVQEWLKQK